MRVFITGATGFIGTEFVRRLSGTPHEAICLARPHSRDSRVDALRAMGAGIVSGDVTNPASLAEGMRGCEWVVHLASVYEFWLPDTRVFDRVNIQGTRNVMGAALAARASKVIHVSSVVAYGATPGTVTEATPLTAPVHGHYGRTKRAAEQVARGFHERRGLPVVIIAPGAVLGAGDPKSTGRYLADLVKGRLPAQVFPDSPFPFVHVRDVAESILLALEKNGNAGEKYIVVGETSSFGAVNRMAAELAGVRAPRLTMPGVLAMAGANVATLFARVTGRPPLMGMALEQFRLLRKGLTLDASKVERELGLHYTPLRVAIEDELREMGHLAAAPSSPSSSPTTPPGGEAH